MDTTEGKPNKLNYFPFRSSLFGFKKSTSTEEKNKGKLKEPIALVLKDNYDIDIYENVKAGTLNVPRADEKVEILIPKSKILSFSWGGETIRGWIVDVKEAVALPTNTLHDSLEIERTVDQMQINYKKYKTSQTSQRLKGIAGIIMWIGIAIGIIILALALADAMGLNILQEMNRPAQTAALISKGALI